MKLSYRSTQSYIVKDYDNVRQTQLPFITHYSHLDHHLNTFILTFMFLLKIAITFLPIINGSIYT